jgi:hypothetical protein
MILGFSGQVLYYYVVCALVVHIDMISVENFYWVLFQNLLQPAGLDCWYYYPWGTQDHLSQKEWFPYHSQADLNHVLFHFDQEPLWNHDLGHAYDLGIALHASWSVKKLKILANSEHSEIKRQICKDRSMLDWYFFYHGFAALDWYRDARHVDVDHAIQNAFLSLNHLISHRRSYRISLLARLLDREVAHKGSISFHADSRDVMTELASMYTQVSVQSRNLIERHLDSTLRLPWQLDRITANGNLSARFGAREYQLWQTSLFHVVNETVFYEPKQHLTEKVFKPIVAKRPFLLVAAPGNLQYLRQYGFQTFDKWIDESYDRMLDHDQRLDAIANEIVRISSMPTCQLRDLYQDMLPVLEHNRWHFYNVFPSLIVSELVDNFGQCLRIWNNGRIDGRDLPIPADFEKAKQTLLG